MIAGGIEPSYWEHDGRTVVYREHGTGPPMLLLHGIPTSSHLWRRFQRLTSDEAHTYAIDFLGYGASDKPADLAPSLPIQAALAAAFIREVVDEPCIVVGHDIGGGVAQLVAVDEPDLVRGLVLVDTIAYDSWPEPNIERMKDPAWDEIIQRIDLEEGFRKGLMAGVTREEVPTADLAAIYSEPFEGDEGRSAYLRAARSLRTDDLLTRAQEIEALDVRVLIVWGKSDPYQDPSYGERLRDALSQADLTLIDAGHFVPEEAPEELTASVRAWLAHVP